MQILLAKISIFKHFSQFTGYRKIFRTSRMVANDFSHDLPLCSMFPEKNFFSRIGVDCYPLLTRRILPSPVLGILMVVMVYCRLVLVQHWYTVGMLLVYCRFFVTTSMPLLPSVCSGNLQVFCNIQFPLLTSVCPLKGVEND